MSTATSFLNADYEYINDYFTLLNANTDVRMISLLCIYTVSIFFLKVMPDETKQGFSLVFGVDIKI